MSVHRVSGGSGFGGGGGGATTIGRREGHVLVDEIAEYLRSQPGDPTGEPRGGGGANRARVLLPYSGSATADRALEAMIRLAPVLSCEVRVLHVRGFDTCQAGRFFVRTHAEAVALTREAIARLRRRGVRAVGVMRKAPRADVHRAVLAEADEWQASMILLGARRRRTLVDLLRHSVVRQVLRRATCPVLVVRTDVPFQKDTPRRGAGHPGAGQPPVGRPPTGRPPRHPPPGWRQPAA